MRRHHVFRTRIEPSLDALLGFSQHVKRWKKSEQYLHEGQEKYCQYHGFLGDREEVFMIVSGDFYECKPRWFSVSIGNKQEDPRTGEIDYDGDSSLRSAGPEKEPDYAKLSQRFYNLEADYQKRLAAAKNLRQEKKRQRELQ
jgi:hypothetical protein